MRVPPESTPEQPSDPELMRLVGTGDMNALAALVQRHQDRVRRTAYRVLGRWDVADDVTQEAFLRLHRNAANYSPMAAFFTWLHRIVVNLCLDHLKRRKAQPLGPLERPDPAAETDPLEREERVAAVQRELAQLPDRQRVVIVLHRFEGLGHKEIAATTGWSESAVESLLVRAYARLRERLRPWAES